MSDRSSEQALSQIPESLGLQVLSFCTKRLVLRGKVSQPGELKAHLAGSRNVNKNSDQLRMWKFLLSSDMWTGEHKPI